MAEPELKEQFLSIAPLAELILSPNAQLPPNTTVEQIEESLWSLARQALLETDLERISKVKQRSDRLRDLIFTLREAAFKSKDPHINSSLKELVANFESVRLARKKEAAAKVADQPTIHTQITKSIQTAIANVRKLSPQGADRLESVATALPDILITQPEVVTALPTFVTNVTDTPVSESKLLQALGPAVSTSLDPVITVLFVQSCAELVGAGIPIQVSEEAAAALTYEKITHSNAPAESYTELVHELEVAGEAETGKTITIPQTVTAKLAEYRYPTTPDALLADMMATQATVLTGLDYSLVNQLTKPLVYSGLATLAADVAQYTPSTANQSRTDQYTDQAFTFASLTADVLSRTQQTTSRFSMATLRTELQALKPSSSATPTPELPLSLQRKFLAKETYAVARQLLEQQQLEQTSSADSSSPKNPRRPSSELTKINPLSEMLDIFSQGKDFVIDNFGEHVWEAGIKWFGNTFLATTETAVAETALSTIGAAIGTATGAVVGTSIATTLAAKSASSGYVTLVAMQSGYKALNQTIINQAVSKGLLSFLGSTPKQGGVFMYLANPNQLQWLTQNLLPIVPGAKSIVGQGMGIAIKTIPKAFLQASLKSLTGATVSATTTAVTTAGSSALTTATVSAAAGNAVVPILGAIIGFILGLISPFVLKAIKKFLSSLPFIFIALGSMIGAALSGSLLSVGAFAGAIGGYLVQQAGTMFFRPASVNITQPTAIQNIATIINRISFALATVITTEIILPIIIIFLVIPPTIALFLFVINNSAYMVPPDTSGLVGGPGPNPGPGGAFPNCLPMEGGLTQHAYCEDGHNDWSHCGFHSNAIDISGSYKPVYATHDGNAYYNYFNNIPEYGKHVVVFSNSPNTFATLYAHLDSFTQLFNNTPVTSGTQIGVSDNTGNSTGHHLHYEYIDADAARAKTIRAYRDHIRTIVPNYPSGANGCYASEEGGSDDPQP